MFRRAAKEEQHINSSDNNYEKTLPDSCLDSVQGVGPLPGWLGRHGPGSGWPQSVVSPPCTHREPLVVSGGPQGVVSPPCTHREPLVVSGGTQGVVSPACTHREPLVVSGGPQSVVSPACIDTETIGSQG